MQNIFLELFKVKANQEKNLLISPYCFEILCRIVAEGTSGNVNKELLSILEVQLDEDIISPLFDKVDSLKEINVISTIEQTNSIYLRPNSLITPVDSFYQKIKGRLSFDLKELKNKDIRIDVENKDAITFIIESVLNIKAKWKQPFKNIRNIHEPFNLTNGESVETYFIEHECIGGGNLTKYFQEEKFHAIQIPMKDERLCVEIYLPYEKDGIENFIEELKVEDLLNWGEQFQEQNSMHVILPKFEIEAEYKELKDDFQKLGIQNLFKESWDFVPMFQCEETIFIAEITQENKFRLDEVGIEAGSTTRMYGVIGSTSRLSQFIFFEANHPFVYLVRDQKTNTILFLGVFEEPDRDIDFSIYHSNLKVSKKFVAQTKQFSLRAEFVFAIFTINSILNQVNYKNKFLDWYVELLWKLVGTPLGNEFDEINFILKNVYWEDYEIQSKSLVVPEELIDSKKEILELAPPSLANIFYIINITVTRIDDLIKYDYERNALLFLSHNVLMDLNLRLPSIDIFSKHKPLENNLWGNPIEKFDFDSFFEPLDKEVKLSDEDLKQRASNQAIRRIKPKIWDLTIRGAVYFHLLSLNTFIKEKNPKHPLIQKLIEQVIGFLEGENELDKIELTSFEFRDDQTGFMHEAPYFQTKEDSDAFQKTYPAFSKVMRSVAWIYHSYKLKEKGEYYFDGRYKSTVGLLESYVKKNLPLPDFDFFEQHKIKSDNELGDPIRIDKKLLGNIL